VHFQCSHCAAIVEIEDSDAGQAVACGECGGVVVVPATRFSAGAVIGDFVLQKELGQGGMGVVYLARQLSLDRLCALKVLNARFAADANYVSDFIREARAAAQLNHPGIVQAYAVGEDEGIYYFAMEYVQGTTMKQMLALSGRLAPDRALEMIAQVNTALEFAWQHQKLVHRDIKPDNIMLTESGQVKLADLGLARPAADLMDQAAEDIMGTPQYISPEALLQKPQDNRSDIYSLGATLYHAITGRFPYLGDNAVEFAQKHLTERLLPPNKVMADIPEPLSRLVELMMTKRPEHRYANSTELAKDIALVKEGKMPERRLVPDAQRPLPVEGLSSRRKLRIGPGGKPAAPPIGRPLVAKKRLPLKVILWLFGGGVGLLAAVAITLLIVGLIERSKTPEQKELDRLRKSMTKAQYQGYLAFQQAAQLKKPAAEVLGAARAFLAAHGATLPAEVQAALAERTAPFEETELESLRQAAHARQVTAWNAELRRRAEQEQRRAEADAAEAERLRQQEAERLRQEEAKRQQELRLAELKGRQPTIRDQAIDFGRDNRFGDAITLFRKYASDARGAAELVAWADRQVQVQEQAEKFLDLLVDQERAVKAKPYNLAELGYRVGQLRLLTRGRCSFAVERVDPRTFARTPVTIELAMGDIPTGVLVEMGRAAASARQMPAAESNLLTAAYLAARGDFTSLPAIRQLLAAAERELASFLLADLAAAEPLMTEKEFSRKLIEFKAKAREGDRPAALRLARELRDRFTDRWPEIQEEVTEALKSM